MRRGLLASFFLVLATAAGLAVSGAAPIQASSASGLWSNATRLSAGREEHTATLLRNGTVLVTGGTDGRGKALASAEVYNPATNRWTPAGSMASARLDHTATLLPSGKVLVAGGLGASFPSSSLATAELYDPTTNAWSTAAPMIGARARHTATLLPDGRVLVVGGLSVALREGGLWPSQPTGAEIYDPKANRWTATAPMALYRLDQTATLLSDGRVLVAGGQDGLISFDSVEIYDTRQDRWQAAAPMVTGRSGHAAALLANGDVLVAGGTYSTVVPSNASAPLSSAEIYDPALNSWSTVARMAEVRVEHTATSLSGGMVLVIGATGQSRAEIYDPVHNIWSQFGETMNRYNHTATRLSNGEVLVVGGYGIESLGSVLLYDPNGEPPVPGRPIDPRLVVGGLLAVLLVVGGVAWSIPAVRRRLRSRRPNGGQEEWIT
ncbi:MAG TPA: kelch repeat-containing protein [Candidatus Dormibacteraeota bacterium]|jgi:N-acetylneuraminic acid mutarotase|nr:kelch repeat-containing protein [Candidatus Dormibacteraeota bacterium]